MRQGFWTLFTVGILASSVATGAFAYASRTFHMTAASGEMLILGHGAPIGADCKAIGKYVVRVLREPEHGRITIRHANALPNPFKADSSLAKCNDARVPSVIVEYRSERGYTGTDHVEINFISTTGEEYPGVFEITVK